MIETDRHTNRFVLEIKDLRKSFGDKPVLNGFNLQLSKGENLVIMGKSGSGKSVMIKCLVGLIQADSGSIKIKGQDITVTLKRGADVLNVPVKVSEHGNLGVVWGAVSLTDLEKLGYYNLAEKSYSFGEAIPAGTTKAWTTLTNYIKQMKKIFNPSTGAYKGLGGFISIGSIFPSEFSWQTFWNITAFLSIMLGFMNLLPIPALDGGHVVFTLWEMITGKKPGDKFLEYAQLTGFIILIVLLLFANGNDIFRLFK